MPIRVLIADDHFIVRHGLLLMLEALPELEIVGEASDGAEALQMVRELQPDVVLMDMLMPVMNGAEATAAIRREVPHTQVVMLTSALDEQAVTEALQAGAISYIYKDSQVGLLIQAIQAAVLGQALFSPQVVTTLMKHTSLHPTDTAPDPSGSLLVESLSNREIDVLRLLTVGQSNKEIAVNLNLSEQTVKTYVRRILAKLEVQSRVQAVMRGLELGLTEVNLNQPKKQD
ncbi:MAG: response regulator transcription factor [Chloroflexi bacterium]|nr:response regulator transcription factor [Chloroflexota bacterium]